MCHTPSIPPPERTSLHHRVRAFPDVAHLAGGYCWGVGRGGELGFHLPAPFMLEEVKKASRGRLEGWRSWAKDPAIDADIKDPKGHHRPAHPQEQASVRPLMEKGPLGHSQVTRRGFNEDTHLRVPSDASAFLTCLNSYSCLGIR